MPTSTLPRRNSAADACTKLNGPKTGTVRSAAGKIVNGQRRPVDEGLNEERRYAPLPGGIDREPRIESCTRLAIATKATWHARP
jgi:hypothetical protein